MSELPSDIDPHIRALVESLNAFRGIRTLGSCGGHPAPLKGGQWEEGSWYVTFTVEKNDYGWFALEFLAWAVNHDYVRDGRKVELYPDAPPPYLNGPGTVLRFALQGHGGESPEELATWLRDLKRKLYISPSSPLGEEIRHLMRCASRRARSDRSPSPT